MKISIVTPSYNQAEYIGRTLESVLSQKGDFDLEYIIMDGGSDDGTVDILEQYQSDVDSGKYTGLQGSLSFSWVSQSDKGQSDAINK